MPKSLYIHIPFCRKKCPYCDFYSVNYQRDIATAYVDVLCQQIESLEGDFNTIYIGGGTPTVLDNKLWKKLLDSLSKVYNKQFEFSLEANPESLDRSKIRLFRKGAVNRISVGVQSLQREKLKKLGRIHNPKEAIKKVLALKQEGFDNISIDLIFGVWGQDLLDWQRELQEATKLPITHISLYCLTYERNTALFKEVRKHRVVPLDEARVAQMYKYALQYLPKKGFFQYEISNFSRKGYQCQHNLNYWNNNSYLGLGTSAVSYYKGVRQRYISDISNYIKRVKKAESLVESRERLPPLKRAKETAALKIRTNVGINLRWFRQKTGFDFLELEREALEILIAQGLVKYTFKKGTLEGVSLTRRGILFSDTVSSLFL